ncbi:hypothetical protein JHK87_022178 [Glycine soja]|nr:hypothetical protein JHK87_022178 [Glycine soja]
MPHSVNFQLFLPFHTLKTKALPFSTLIDVLCSHLHQSNGSVEHSLSKVKPKLDSQSIIQVLNTCRDRPYQPQLGVRFFVWAGFQSGYRHSSYMYTKASNLLRIHHNPQIIRDVIESYEAEGSLVTVNMFREVLKLCKEAQLADMALLCCKKGDIETALKLTSEMSSNGLCPDLITYMAIVEGFSNAGRSEEAYSVLKVMRLHGCSPNLVILSAILDGFCRSGSMERALELLDEMEKGGVCTPNVVTYTSVIQSFCKRGQWKEALDILDRMKAFGCHANHVTVFTLVESLCADGHVEQGYGLFDKFVDRILDGFYLLEAIENKGCLSSIDSDIYSILLIGLCQRSHLKEATKLAKIMLKKSVLLQPPHKDAAIDILIKSGEKDLVNQLTGIHKKGL